MPRTFMLTKLYSPRLQDPLLARSELVARLEEGKAGAVTVIVAPAGYGKTTLVGQWAAQTNLAVAWLSLDEGDNDLVHFLAYVAAAVRHVFSGACSYLQGILEREPLPDIPRLALALSNEFEALPQRCALVLDDYHCITTPAIEQLLNELLRHPARNLHLVITSRRQPGLSLARLRSSRRVNEFHAGDLRLTLVEAETLLDQKWQGGCTSEAAATLLTRTEGWLAGMHMVVLALGAEPSWEGLIDAQAHSADRYAADFLLEQVLLQQQPLVRDFLLKTAILERLTGGLAEAVLDSAGSSTGITLAGIARAGLFLNALDDTGEWYTYHRLFRSLLLRQLEMTVRPGEIGVLHRRASAWFCRNGLFDEALRHAFAAGASALALQIVNDHAALWLEQEHWRTLERRLNLFGPQLWEQSPWLLVTRAHVLIQQYKWQSLLPLATRAEQCLADSKYPLPPAQERLLRSYLDIVWAVHWSACADAPKAIAAAQCALHELPLNHYYARGLVQLSLTLSLQSNGEAYLAEQMLTAALAQAELSPGGSRATLRPLMCLLSIYFKEGNIAEAAQTSRILLQKARETNSLADQQLAYLALGAAAYEMNDLDTAVTCFQQGADLRHAGNVRTGHECLVGLALSFSALGRQDALKATVVQLADFHAEVASSLLNAEAISLQRRVGLFDSGCNVNDLLRRSVDARTSIWYGWFEIPVLTQVRLVLTEAQPRNLAQAEATLNQLWLLAVESHKPAYQAALLALKAILQQHRRQTAAAMASLRQALAIGEERGLVRSIADAGPRLQPLLAQLAATEPSTYLERVRAAVHGTGSQVAASNGMPSRGQAPPHRHAIVELAAPLTRREREVLALLGQYRTDREIAEALVISPLTVRTHIENLSSKLAVNGRRAIVARAREHGLLA